MDKEIAAAFEQYTRLMERRKAAAPRRIDDNGPARARKDEGFELFREAVRESNEGKPHNERITENPKKLRRIYRRFRSNLHRAQQGA